MASSLMANFINYINFSLRNFPAGEIGIIPVLKGYISNGAGF